MAWLKRIQPKWIREQLALAEIRKMEFKAARKEESAAAGGDTAMKEEESMNKDEDDDDGKEEGIDLSPERRLYEVGHYKCPSVDRGG